MPATANKLLPSAAQLKASRLLQPFTWISRITSPRREKMVIGPEALRVAAKRVPSGDRSNHQLSWLGSTANRVSSGPRPFNGSKAVTTAGLRSAVDPAVAHKSDGARAAV